MIKEFRFINIIKNTIYLALLTLLFVFLYNSATRHSKVEVVHAQTFPICITATEDTYVQENSAGSNYGNAAQVRAGAIYTAPGTAFYLAYFKFNAGLFPAAYDKAEFKVYQSGSDGAAGGLSVHLHKINGPWTEESMVWSNKPAYDATSWGQKTMGGWDNNNKWYVWDITSKLKTNTIPNGLVLREYRYTPSCDGSTSPTCRAGASRGSYLDSSEAANTANRPQICFSNTPSPTPTPTPSPTLTPVPPSPTPTTPAQPVQVPGCITATEDTYVQENSAGSNFGNSVQVRAGAIYTAPGTAFYLAYFKFNTAQIPASYDKAEFKVRQVGSDGAAGDLPVHLHKINGTWSEGSMVWSNKPAYDATSWGQKSMGGWGNNNKWYVWDITAKLKSNSIPNGLMLRESRYTPSCDGSTSPTCRAGASRGSYLDSSEAANTANRPQICFSNILSPTPNTCSKKNQGDANCDGVVNDADYTIWKCEFLGGGTCTAPPSVKTADFNGNNKVDLVDYEIWRSTRYPHIQ